MTYMGKPDAIDLICVCNASIRVGTWYKQPPPGWDPIGWERLMSAVDHFLAYRHNNK